MEAVDFCLIKVIMTQRCTQIFLIIVIMDWLTDNDFLWQQEYFKWHPSWLWCISWHNINHWMSLMTRVSQLLDNTCTAALQSLVSSTMFNLFLLALAVTFATKQFESFLCSTKEPWKLYLSVGFWFMVFETHSVWV